MTSGRSAYITPLFADSDPMVCHSIAMRPSLWTVFFARMQDWALPGQWYQDDPTHATVQEVITEIIDATDNAVFSGCTMIGEIKELVLNEVPAWLLPCNGDEYLGEDWPELWAVINDNLKTDSTHFRTPNRNRRIGWGETVGQQEGSETHTNAIEELVPHDHPYDQPVGEFLALTGEEPVVLFINPTATTGSTGGGAEYSILNPVEGAQFYIVAALPTAG